MEPSPATQASLLVRLRDAADSAAWTQFVEIYAPLVYGFGRKKGLQDADAADLTQEVLATVSHAIQKFDYDPVRGAFRGWLFTIVRNKLRNVLQRRPPGSQGAGDTTALEQLHAQPAPTDDEESLWQRDCEQRLLAWAADIVRPTVDAATWQAFWRTAVDGEPAKDVAAALQLSVAAVYMAKSRTLARLKEVIHEVQGSEE